MSAVDNAGDARALGLERSHLYKKRQQLGIESGPGLAGVLAGAIPIDETIRSVALQALGSEETSGYQLDVLAAGTMLPANPGELVESQEMAAVLERARATYDFIVIDTPPLTAVSDAFPLLAAVDGVVVVGWVGRSKREAAERLNSVLTRSGATLLGVIANGSDAGAPGAYGENVKATAVIRPGHAVLSSEELAQAATSSSGPADISHPSPQRHHELPSERGAEPPRSSVSGQTAGRQQDNAVRDDAWVHATNDKPTPDRRDKSNLGRVIRLLLRSSG